MKKSADEGEIRSKNTKQCSRKRKGKKSEIDHKPGSETSESEAEWIYQYAMIQPFLQTRRSTRVQKVTDAIT